MKFPIYMDNHATTPVDPAVLEAMMPYLKDKFGNVASVHMCGRDVVGPVTMARKQVADLIGATLREIVFTSGATESDNLAIKGTAFANQDKGRHIITQVTEHKAVLSTCDWLEEHGFAVTRLQVDAHGRVTARQVQEALRTGAAGTMDRTVLVSIMGANNEIGTLQPVKEIGAVCRDAGVLFHTDAAQCAGKADYHVKDCGVDLASFSSHKIYGPKGVGALYVRSGTKIEAQMHGGGQEFGMRSGTLAVPMVVALGHACLLAGKNMQEEQRKLTRLRRRLFDGLQRVYPRLRLNGDPEHRLAGNLSITFPGIEGDLLIPGLTNICCSNTSACASGSEEVSHVLTALGLSKADCRATIRFGIGRFNTEAEVDYVIDAMDSALQRFAG